MRFLFHTEMFFLHTRKHIRKFFHISNSLILYLFNV